MKKPSIAFVNDTSIYESHFGCQLVSQTFREQFARTGLDLQLSIGRDFDINEYAKRLSRVDLVVINGEGSIHRNRNRHLLDLAARFPSVLLNCVYQNNSPHDGLAKFLFISARESSSTAEINRSGGRCVTVPDAMFASSFLRSFQKPEPVLELGETDNVQRQYRRLGPFKIRQQTGFPILAPTVSAYLEKLCSHRRLCIGRFHAAVASSVLEIPFSTWDSNTWKTRAMMHDMGVPHLHFDSHEEAKAGVPMTFPEEIRRFASEAKHRVECTFDQIARIAYSQSRESS